MVNHPSQYLASTALPRASTVISIGGLKSYQRLFFLLTRLLKNFIFSVNNKKKGKYLRSIGFAEGMSRMKLHQIADKLVLKGKGWDPTTMGNELGYLIGCLIWNEKRGWVGAIEKLFDQFELVKSMYYGARTGARIAKRLYRNEVNYAKKRKNKVCYILYPIFYA